MMIYRQSRAWFGSQIFLLFILLIAGCSSGDDSPSGGDPGTSGGEVVAGPVPIVAHNLDSSTVTNISVPVQLDGAKNSYSSTGAPLSYSWSFLYKPPESNAELRNRRSSIVSFTADAMGIYLVELRVTAGGVSSRDVASVLIYNGNRSYRNTHPDSLVEAANHNNLPSHCADCHGGEDYNADGDLIMPKAGDHIATSNLCQACHTSFGFQFVDYVDHIEVFGNCSECHNGVIAIGKSDRHQPTQAECDECHSTSGFLELEPDGSFDHSNISSECSVC
ncbi:hypothetical protein, partial [Kaarinaea lacus]